MGEPRGYRYLSFDDEAVQQAAKRDPIGFVKGLPRRTILDEVQRVPEIFTSLKAVIDQRRTAGRLILGVPPTSCWCRISPTRSPAAWAFCGCIRSRKCEFHEKRPRFIETLFRGGFRTTTTDRLRPALAERIVGEGYPAALARRTPARRRAWYRDLVETQIQRDVRDVARIHSLDALPRLLALTASQTAQLLNVSDLAAPFQMTRQTIHDYVTVLERVFLVDVDFFHYRDRDDFEVDIVLERGSASVAGVEVKAAASVTEADFRGLRKLRDAAGRQFAAGVVLYDGASAVRFGDSLFAVPLRILWGGP